MKTRPKSARQGEPPYAAHSRGTPSDAAAASLCRWWCVPRGLTSSAVDMSEYSTVRLKATLPRRSHLWDVGRFWPEYEDTGDKTIQQDDDGFRRLTHGLVHKEDDKGALLRRTFVRSAAAPRTDPFCLVSRFVVAELGPAAMRRAAEFGAFASLGGAGGSGSDGSLGEGALAIAVQYEPHEQRYVVWFPPRPTYRELKLEEWQAAPSPLPPASCATGWLESVPALSVRAHSVPANTVLLPYRDVP